MAAALYASQITRAKRFCPMAAANAAVEEANSGTCRSAATVRYLSRAAHESGGAAGYVVEVGHTKCATAP